jgi:hypothetical protein|tara:strand:+ start:615 stop:800 length:186 start_codon:yes stop_codon:yes gene_type:complete
MIEATIVWLLISFPMDNNPSVDGKVVRTFTEEITCLKAEALLDKHGNYECHQFSFNLPKGY